MRMEGEPVRREGPPAVAAAGVVLALVGTAGDLVWHALHPHQHAELFSFSSGETPWHLALFLGLALTAVGVAMWASRLRSDRGTLLGTSVVLLLVLTGLAAGWSAVAGRAPAPEEGEHAHAATSGLPRAEAAAPAHDHAAPAADDGAQPAGVPGGGAHEHRAPEVLTPAEQAEVDAMLATTRKATWRYRDVEVAKADGYFQVTQFIPGIGLHLFNPKFAGRFDPATPQILVYMPGRGDRLKLAGVSWTLPKRSDVEPEGFPGRADVWHYHENLCFIRGGSVTVATKADCGALGGFHQATTGWMLHAWLYVESPEGVFSAENSAVA